MHTSTRSRLSLFLVLLLVFTAGPGLHSSLRGVAHAASPHLWLSQKVGPPTATVQVHGDGFGHGETVLVDFKTTPVGTATTDSTGKFVVQITVPKTALPGTHRVLATGLSSGLTAQTLFLIRTDWSQFRFGPHQTGYNPYENVLSPSNVSALTLDWNYATGNDILSSPTVANGVVYIGSYDGKLYALDAVTGALKWSYTMIGYFAYSPAVVNGVVYLGSGFDSNWGNGYVYALDAMTGALKWSYTTVSDISSSPTVAGGMVYISTGYPDEKLYALDAMTGALKWSYTTAGASVGNTPAVANGMVYVDMDTMYALDAVTGTLKWSYTPMYNSFYPPAIVNGVVYFGSQDTSVHALDAVTGALKWSYKTGNNYFFSSSPAVANGVVYIGSRPSTSGGNHLYALDATTGTLKWSYAMGGGFVNSYPSSSPAVANGVVYVGSDDYHLYALDAMTGTLKWSYITGFGIYSSPAVANGIVYVGSGDGNVYAFHLPGFS